MKKYISLLLVFVLIFTFVSCGSSNSSEGSDLTPTETLDAFIQALKAKDFDTLQKYYEGEIGDLSMLQEEDDSALSGIVEGLMDKILDFEYTLDNEVITEDTATVDLHFKTYDLGKIMQDLITAILSDATALGLAGLDQEEMEAEVNEIMTQKFNEAIENAEKDLDIPVTMDLVKKDGSWVVKDISEKDDFMNALSGGLLEFTEGLSQMAGE